MQTNRRDFLKASGLAVSGALLGACGTSPNPIQPPIGSDAVLPNGYQFFMLKNSRQPLVGGVATKNLRLDAAIDSEQRVYYSAVDSSGRIALYRLQLEFQGNTPRVVQDQRLIRTDDWLDGRKVVEINAHDINDQGHLAVVLKFETETDYNTTDDQGNFDGGKAKLKMQALYLETGQGLVRVLKEHQTNPEGHEFAGMFGDVTFHNNQLLVVANYYHHAPNSFKEVRQGVFGLVAGSPEARLVVSSGIPLAANTSAPLVSQFGLICLHDKGQFVLQTTLTPAHEMAAAFVQGASQTAVLRGNLNTLGVASARTGVANNLRVEASSISSGLHTTATRANGLTYYAPRSGANQQVAHVVIQDKQHSLLLNNQVLLQTGNRTPTGRTVREVATPHLAQDGLVFFQVSTEAGVELVVSNGKQNRTILRNRDRLANYASPIGNFIGLGYTAMHTDDAGKLVFVVDHEDETQSLVVGIPL
jgi:hypothetical protein